MSAEKLPDNFRINTDGNVRVVVSSGAARVRLVGVLTDVKNDRTGFWLRLAGVHAEDGTFVRAPGAPLVYVPAENYGEARR